MYTRVMDPHQQESNHEQPQQPQHQQPQQPQQPQQQQQQQQQQPPPHNPSSFADEETLVRAAAAAAGASGGAPWLHIGTDCAAVAAGLEGHLPTLVVVPGTHDLDACTPLWEDGRLVEDRGTAALPSGYFGVVSARAGVAAEEVARLLAPGGKAVGCEAAPGARRESPVWDGHPLGGESALAALASAPAGDAAAVVRRAVFGLAVSVPRLPGWRGAAAELLERGREIAAAAQDGKASEAGNASGAAYDAAVGASLLVPCSAETVGDDELAAACHRAGWALAGGDMPLCCRTALQFASRAAMAALRASGDLAWFDRGSNADLVRQARVTPWRDSVTLSVHAAGSGSFEAAAGAVGAGAPPGWSLAPSSGGAHAYIVPGGQLASVRVQLLPHGGGACGGDDANKGGDGPPDTVFCRLGPVRGRCHPDPDDAAARQLGGDGAAQGYLSAGVCGSAGPSRVQALLRRGQRDREEEGLRNKLLPKVTWPIVKKHGVVPQTKQHVSEDAYADLYAVGLRERLLKGLHMTMPIVDGPKGHARFDGKNVTGIMCYRLANQEGDPDRDPDTGVEGMVSFPFLDLGFGPGPPPKHGRRKRTCALVGGAGSILRSKGFGARIDSHETVFRMNDHPYGGEWAESVGTRCDWRGTFHTIFHGGIGDRARHVSGERYFMTHDQTIGPKDGEKMLTMLRKYPDAGPACVMPNVVDPQTHGMYPHGKGTTTGLNVAMLLSQMCDAVSLFGFDATSKPHKYFKNQPGGVAYHAWSFEDALLSALDGIERQH